MDGVGEGEFFLGLKFTVFLKGEKLLLLKCKNLNTEGQIQFCH